MNQPIEISIESWLKTGWSTYKECYYPLIVGSTIISLIGLVFTIVVHKGLFIWPAMFYTYLIGPIITVGWYLLCLNCVRRKPASINDLIVPFRRYFPIVGMLLVFMLGGGIGIIFLIIPGIYIILRYFMCYFVVLDKNLGPLESLEYAGKISKGHLLKFLGLFVIVGLMGLFHMPFYLSFSPMLSEYRMILLTVGILPFIASVLLLIPLASTSIAATYESMSQDWESRQIEENSKIQSEGLV